MTDDARSTAIDLLARQAISDCVHDSIHHYVGLRKLPKTDLDAIRARAREVADEVRPTYEAFENAYDELAHGGAV